MTNEEIISGIISGNRYALAALVDTFQQQIIKTAYYFTASMEEAEDITQEVLMEIVQSAGNFRGNAGLSTWIYRITVNKSLNQIRKNKRKMIFIRIGNLFAERDSSFREPSHDETVFDRLESKELLNKALGALPERQRTAFVLHKFDELSYKEIASIMQVTLPTVESLIQRAKAGLQKTLRPHFPEYSKS